MNFVLDNRGIFSNWRLTLKDLIVMPLCSVSQTECRFHNFVQQVNKSCNEIFLNISTSIKFL